MAVEFVGSALLSASLQVAFDRLASAEVVEYFQRTRFNDKLLKKLTITLLSINAVLDDAEQKQIRNQHVKAWLDAVKEAVFEGEDLLDEIAIQVSRCKHEATKVWNFFYASTNSFDKEIESKMQEVLDRLEYLAGKKDILGLKVAGLARVIFVGIQPSEHLKELSIRSYGGTRFPDWFGDNSLSTLVSLKLSNCEKCISLPPLGILLSLKKLCIFGLSGVAVIGTEFYGSSFSSVPFPSLETLEFEDMEEWEKWECITAKNAFPHLQKLSIKNCSNLRECLPEKLPCLTVLEISHCEELVASVPRTPFIHALFLNNCGELQFDYHPSTLKILKIDGYCMDGSLHMNGSDLDKLL